MRTTGAQPADERRRHVTTLLRNWTGGDDAALQELVPIVYDELRPLAQKQMSREREDHILQATALVNEAFCDWWTFTRFSGAIERTSSPWRHE